MSRVQLRRSTPEGNLVAYHLDRSTDGNLCETAHLIDLDPIVCHTYIE